MPTLDDISELDDFPELATIDQRLKAFLVDTILAALVVVLAFALAAWCSSAKSDAAFFPSRDGVPTFLITFAIVLFGWTLFVLSEVASTGQTLGKKQLGIKTVSIESIIDGEEIQLGFGKAFAREILGKNVLGPLTLGMGLLAPLFSERRQGLQDTVAGTIVVKSDEYEEWIY